MNSPQQLFRLHWKNHSPNFVTCFSQLLNSESLVDVTLAAEGKQIQAHRVVLSACSTYFQELFVSHSSQHPIVILKDINFKDLCTVIHFMYYGEVNIQHDQLNSILKTAEVLRIKGFSDVADKESFSSALLKEDQAYRTSLNRQSSSSEQHSSHDAADADGGGPSVVKRKRQRQNSGSSQSKSSQERSAPPQQQALRRETFLSSSRDGSSSFRSSIGSFDNNSVIKSQSSLLAQSSTESNAADDVDCFNRDDGQHDSGNGANTAPGTLENGSPLSSGTVAQQPKQKRNRPLIRQERVTRKEGEKDPILASSSEAGRASPIIHSLTPILPKSPKSVEATDVDVRARIQTSSSTTTYLQLPPTTATQLIRQRSQPSPSGTVSFVGSGRSLSQTPPPPASSLSFLAPAKIPTLAVTPVSSTAPNIVIEQYPTILRVVSFEEMNMATEFQASSSIPSLIRTASQSGNTLQVPSITVDPLSLDIQPSSHSGGSIRSKVKTDDLRRSVSNPGVSLSSTAAAGSGGTGNAATASNGHCPVLRTGAALGCNFCWNTNDSQGRILRRKTKYHCPDCQANLCIVPCFQEYHEKFVSSNESGSKSSGPPSNKNTTVSHQQVLSKMSSI